MNKNICEVCGTENEEEYKYCKNCGSSLKQQATENEPEGSATPLNEEPVVNNSFNITNDFDGVSAQEMAIFVGKKAEKILPKFSKMQLIDSKVSWAWPVAILGYFLGPMGSALWFFYRKMYKPAVILAVIGAVITIITGVMSLGGGELIPEAAINAFAEGNFEQAFEIFNNGADDVTISQKILDASASFIKETANILTCVITGIYGYYIYKKHCIKKITEYRALIADNRFYKIGLASVGGQSVGMLVVGILLMVAAESVVNFVSLIYTIVF